MVRSEQIVPGAPRRLVGRGRARADTCRVPRCAPAVCHAVARGVCHAVPVPWHAAPRATRHARAMCHARVILLYNE